MNKAVKESAFEALLDYLKQSRGFAFNAYKRSTLVRRVQKQMQSVGVEEFGDYLNYLEVHPDEFTRLFNTVLINYTGFFRDPAAWNYLARKVVTRIVASKKSHEPIRVWSAGCASGEEAYTLAMLLASAIGEKKFCERVKVYATDVDEEALGQARQGRYTGKELKPVPAKLRDTYFELIGGRYSFRADLRRSIIFGRHDLIQDAPMSHLDLLVCRNTLMYFNAEIQTRILSRFHFAINSRGCLFLGRAEMLLTHANLFSPLELKHRIFIKVANGALRERPLLLAPVSDEEARLSPLSLVSLREAAFEATSAAQVVLDLDGNMVLANERARSLFGLGPRDLGRPFRDLELSYRPVELRSLMDKAYSEQHSVTVTNVQRHLPSGGSQYLALQVLPLLDGTGSLLGTSISFNDVTDYRQLQEERQLIHQKLETAHEELQSTNEELETTNEELQSTNEELETTNEELQSSNEELRSLNDELRQRSEEINQANVFLDSILSSLRVGAVVMDRKLNILMWNQKAKGLWGLDGDEVLGQPFLNLDIGLPVEQLGKTIRACLAGRDDSQEMVLQATNRRGKAIHCRVTCAPLVGKDKERHGVLLLMEEQE